MELMELRHKAVISVVSSIVDKKKRLRARPKGCTTRRCCLHAESRNSRKPDEVYCWLKLGVSVV